MITDDFKQKWEEWVTKNNLILLPYTKQSVNAGTEYNGYTYKLYTIYARGNIVTMYPPSRSGRVLAKKHNCNFYEGLDILSEYVLSAIPRKLIKLCPEVFFQMPKEDINTIANTHSIAELLNIIKIFHTCENHDARQDLGKIITNTNENKFNNYRKLLKWCVDNNKLDEIRKLKESKIRNIVPENILQDIDNGMYTC